MSMSALTWHDHRRPRELVRWVAAGAIVLGIHAGAIIYLFAAHEPEIVGSTADMVTLELAPIESTPDAVDSDVAPAPEAMVEQAPLPDLPRPQEKPQEQVKLERPPDEAPAEVPLPVEKPPEKAQDSPPPAPVTAKPVKAAAPNAEASWFTNVVRQLQSLRRYPAAARSRREEGIVVVNFSVDRSGHVLSRRIAQSSGHTDLDDEVMALVMRAEPLPPFPASMPQQHMDLTLPMRFTLR
jgi:periplasmic protein TonB